METVDKIKKQIALGVIKEGMTVTLKGAFGGRRVATIADLSNPSSVEFKHKGYTWFEPTSSDFKIIPFYVGSKVETDMGSGEIVTVDETDDQLPFNVELNSGGYCWVSPEEIIGLTPTEEDVLDLFPTEEEFKEDPSVEKDFTEFQKFIDVLKAVVEGDIEHGVTIETSHGKEFEVGESITGRGLCEKENTLRVEAKFSSKTLNSEARIKPDIKELTLEEAQEELAKIYDKKVKITTKQSVREG